MAKQSSRQRCYLATIDFQSCDSKPISWPGSVLLQETNLLPRFSGQARDKYHGNPPNFLVFCWIFTKYSAEHSSPAIEFLFFCRQAVYCSRIQLFCLHLSHLCLLTLIFILCLKQLFGGKVCLCLSPNIKKKQHVQPYFEFYPSDYGFFFSFKYIFWS